MIKFQFLSGDVDWKKYSGKLISKKLNNGDFDYWLVLEVLNMHDATGDEDQNKYNVSISAVAPSEVNQKQLDSALAYVGFIDWGYENNPLHLVEALSDYGIFALLWQSSGNNLKKLLKLAHKEAQMIEFLFGLYMDRPENRIGSTGWDCIKGDIFSGLYK